MRGARVAVALSLLIAAPLRIFVTALQPEVVHPLDPAEMKFADPATLARLAGGMGSVAELIAGHENIHHGGFFTVQLLSVAVGQLTEALLGAPEPLLALRALGLGLGLAVTAAWAWAGARLGAPPLLAALSAAVLPLWGTQGALVAWGSHAEAGLWIALWLAARAEGRPRAAAALLGAAAGWDAAIAPLAVIFMVGGLWQAEAPPRAQRLAAFAAGAAPFFLPRLLAGGPRLWQLGLTESDQRRPVDLLVGAVDPMQLWAALTELCGLRFLPRSAGPLAEGIGVAGLVLCGLGLAWADRGRGSSSVARRLCLAGPLLLIATLALFSPLRPAVQHRYLLAFLPAVALWPALAAARGPAPLRPLAALLALGLAAVQIDGHLRLQPSAPRDARRAYVGAAGAPGWQWAAQRGGLEQLHPASAPALRALHRCRLRAVGPEGLDQDAVWRGALLATDRRWGYPLLGEAPRPPRPSPELSRRVAELQAEGIAATGPAAEALWRGVGAGLATLAPLGERRARAALDALPAPFKALAQEGFSTMPCD